MSARLRDCRSRHAGHADASLALVVLVGLVSAVGIFAYWWQRMTMQSPSEAYWCKLSRLRGDHSARLGAGCLGGGATLAFTALAGGVLASVATATILAVRRTGASA